MSNPGKPVHVFIVEDNDPDVFLVEEALRSHGLLPQMQRCQDGEEAIKSLSRLDGSRLPDIIIIDLNLPKVNGLEILKHARSLTQLKRVPVMILTSSQSKADRAKSLELGANAYVAKPPFLPEFLSTVGLGVRRLLEQAGTSARLQPSTGNPRRLHRNAHPAPPCRHPKSRLRGGPRQRGRIRRIAAI